MTSGAADTRGTSGAALVWAVGMLGYVLAVMQRTTFGVAGLDAADRFGISPAALSAFLFLQVSVYISAPHTRSPAALSAFVFLQVSVYISAQLPGGLLVDRWGPRAVLVLGGALLASGQLL